MVKWYRRFSNEHPYGKVVLILVVASIVGITIEYLISGKFYGSGIWTMLFLGIMMMLGTRRELRKKAKKEKSSNKAEK